MFVLELHIHILKHRLENETAFIIQTVIFKHTASCRSYLGDVVCVPSMPQVLGYLESRNDNNHSFDRIIIHSHD